MEEKKMVVGAVVVVVGVGLYNNMEHLPTKTGIPSYDYE
jgi:hypothetical protein